MKNNFYFENSKFLLVFCFGLLGLSFSSTVEAHRGRRAADGCHNVKTTGLRHCHDSPPTQKPKKKIVEKIIISSEAVVIDSCYDGDIVQLQVEKKLDLHA